MSTEDQPDPPNDEVTPSPPPKKVAAQPVTMAEASIPVSAALKNSQGDTPIIVLKPGEASAPAALPPEVRASTAPSPDRPQVHVAPNLLDLVTGRTVTPEEQQAAKERRNLNEVVHQMLVIGLMASTALMLLGLGLDLVLGREVPTAVPNFGDVFNRVIALRPSGFLALGLLVLIATPILRVVGSIFAFLYERDWRYAGITCLVLAVVMTSLVLGKG